MPRSNVHEPFWARSGQPSLLSRRRAGLACLGSVLACLLALSAARAPAASAPNRARLFVAQAIAALGGPAYLQAWHKTGFGRVYNYNGQGQLNGYGMRFWSFSSFPGKQRIELTKKRDVFYIYNGLHGWQVTYRGVTPLNARVMRNYVNVDEHSLGRVLRQWYNASGTLMIDRGLTWRSGRQLERVDLISPQDLTVHLSLALNSHLPQRLSWRKRDRILGTFVRQIVVYGNYQRIAGVMTPMVVERYSGTQPVVETIYYQVAYQPLADSLFIPPHKLPK